MPDQILHPNVLLLAIFF